MKRILLLALLSLSVNAAAENCKLELFPKLLFLDKPKSIKDSNRAFKSTNCSDESTWTAIKTLSLIDGEISEKHFNRLLQEEGFSGTIDISPNKVAVNRIETFIAEQLTIQRGRKVENVKPINNKSVIGFAKNSFFEIACHACNTTGSKNASFVYTDPDNNLERKIWIQFDILKTDQIATAQVDLRPFIKQDLVHNVKLVPTTMKDTSQYIKDLENLKYYKPNKIIKKGEPIKFTDLVPKTLVNTGKLTQVTIQKGGLKIQTQAIARQAGKLNDVINLYNPQSKKQFRGKIVDYNKVIVEL